MVERRARSALSAWSAHTAASARLRRAAARLTAHRCARVLSRCLAAWRVCALEGAALHRLAGRAVLRRRQRLFGAWARRAREARAARADGWGHQPDVLVFAHNAADDTHARPHTHTADANSLSAAQTGAYALGAHHTRPYLGVCGAEVGDEGVGGSEQYAYAAPVPQSPAEARGAALWRARFTMGSVDRMASRRRRGRARAYLLSWHLRALRSARHAALLSRAGNARAARVVRAWRATARTLSAALAEAERRRRLHRIIASRAALCGWRVATAASRELRAKAHELDAALSMVSYAGFAAADETEAAAFEADAHRQGALDASVRCLERLHRRRRLRAAMRAWCDAFDVREAALRKAEVMYVERVLAFVRTALRAWHAHSAQEARAARAVAVFGRRAFARLVWRLVGAWRAIAANGRFQRRVGESAARVLQTRAHRRALREWHELARGTTVMAERADRLTWRHLWRWCRQVLAAWRATVAERVTGRLRLGAKAERAERWREARMLAHMREALRGWRVIADVRGIERLTLAQIDDERRVERGRGARARYARDAAVTAACDMMAGARSRRARRRAFEGWHSQWRLAEEKARARRALDALAEDMAATRLLRLAASALEHWHRCTSANVALWQQIERNDARREMRLLCSVLCEWYRHVRANKMVFEYGAAAMDAKHAREAAVAAACASIARLQGRRLVGVCITAWKQRVHLEAEALRMSTMQQQTLACFRRRAMRSWLRRIVLCWRMHAHNGAARRATVDLTIHVIARRRRGSTLSAALTALRKYTAYKHGRAKLYLRADAMARMSRLGWSLLCWLRFVARRQMLRGSLEAQEQPMYTDVMGHEYTLDGGTATSGVGLNAEKSRRWAAATLEQRGSLRMSAHSLGEPSPGGRAPMLQGSLARLRRTGYAHVHSPSRRPRGAPALAPSSSTPPLARRLELSPRASVASAAFAGGESPSSTAPSLAGLAAAATPFSTPGSNSKMGVRAAKDALVRAGQTPPQTQGTPPQFHVQPMTPAAQRLALAHAAQIHSPVVPVVLPGALPASAPKYGVFVDVAVAEFASAISVVQEGASAVRAMERAFTVWSSLGRAHVSMINKCKRVLERRTRARLLSQCFGSWRSAVWMTAKLRLYFAHKTHRRARAAVAVWREGTRAAALVRVALSRHLEKRVAATLASFFKVWHWASHRSCTHRMLVDKHVVRTQLRRAKVAMQTWRDLSRTNRQLQVAEVAFQRFLARTQHSMLRRCFRQWHAHAMEEFRKQRLLTIFQDRWGRAHLGPTARLLARTLSAWKAQSAYAQMMRASALHLMKQVCRRLLLSAMAEWRAHTLAARRQVSVDRAARMFLKRAYLRKSSMCFAGWASHTAAARRRMLALVRALVRVRRLNVSAIFRRWASLALRTRVTRTLLRGHALSHERSVRRRAFNAWALRVSRKARCARVLASHLTRRLALVARGTFAYWHMLTQRNVARRERVNAMVDRLRRRVALRVLHGWSHVVHRENLARAAASRFFTNKLKAAIARWRWSSKQTSTALRFALRLLYRTVSLALREWLSIARVRMLASRLSIELWLRRVRLSLRAWAHAAQLGAIASHFASKVQHRKLWQSLSTWRALSRRTLLVRRMGATHTRARARRVLLMWRGVVSRYRGARQLGAQVERAHLGRVLAEWRGLALRGLAISAMQGRWFVARLRTALDWWRVRARRTAVIQAAYAAWRWDEPGRLLRAWRGVAAAEREHKLETMMVKLSLAEGYSRTFHRRQARRALLAWYRLARYQYRLADGIVDSALMLRGRTVLRAWHASILQRAREVAATRWSTRRACASVVRAWRTYAMRAARARVRMQGALLRYDRRLAAHVLRGWRAHSRMERRLRDRAVALRHRHSRRTAQRVLRHWRHTVRQHQRSSAAAGRRLRQMLLRILRAWRLEASLANVQRRRAGLADVAASQFEVELLRMEAARIQTAMSEPRPPRPSVWSIEGGEPSARSHVQSQSVACQTPGALPGTRDKKRPRPASAGAAGGGKRAEPPAGSAPVAHARHGPITVTEALPPLAHHYQQQLNSSSPAGSTSPSSPVVARNLESELDAVVPKTRADGHACDSGAIEAGTSPLGAQEEALAEPDPDEAIADFEALIEHLQLDRNRLMQENDRLTEDNAALEDAAEIATFAAQAERLALGDRAAELADLASELARNDSGHGIVEPPSGGHEPRLSTTATLTQSYSPEAADVDGGPSHASLAGRGDFAQFQGDSTFSGGSSLSTSTTSSKGKGEVQSGSPSSAAALAAIIAAAERRERKASEASMAASARAIAAGREAAQLAEERAARGRAESEARAAREEAARATSLAKRGLAMAISERRPVEERAADLQDQVEALEHRRERDAAALADERAALKQATEAVRTVEREARTALEAEAFVTVAKERALRLEVEARERTAREEGTRAVKEALRGERAARLAAEERERTALDEAANAADALKTAQDLALQAERVLLEHGERVPHEEAPLLTPGSDAARALETERTARVVAEVRAQAARQEAACAASVARTAVDIAREQARLAAAASRAADSAQQARRAASERAALTPEARQTTDVLRLHWTPEGLPSARFSFGAPLVGSPTQGLEPPRTSLSAPATAEPASASAGASARSPPGRAADEVGRRPAGVARRLRMG